MNNLPNIEAFLKQLITPIIKVCIRDELQGITSPPAPEPTNRLMTIQETAKFLNLAVPTVYTMTSKHTIPVMKRGKKLYFKQSELEQWLEAGKIKSNAELDAEASEYINKKGDSHV